MNLWWQGPEFLQNGVWPQDLVLAEEYVPLPTEAELTRLVGIFHTQLVSDPFENAGSYMQGIRVIQTLVQKMRKAPCLPDEAFRAWRIYEQRQHFQTHLQQLQHKERLNFNGFDLTMQEGELFISGRIPGMALPLISATSRLAKSIAFKSKSLLAGNMPAWRM